MSLSVIGNTVAASAATEIQKPLTPPVAAQSPAATSRVDTVSLSAAAHAAAADVDHDGDSH
jgi:hypothetical protein